MYYNEKKIETRCLPTSEVRIDDTASPKIIGYAAKFDTWADIGGWFRESVKKGAFAKTIKENDIRALWNHNADYVLGRNKAGTLRLSEDSKGLEYEIKPPKTSWANDLMESMRRNDVTQSSFGFTVNKQDINYETDERVLLDVTLFDISPVTYPAYPTTTADVRAAFQKEKPPTPPPVPPEWEAMDKIIEKVKAGEELTEEEIRCLTAYIPSLSIPPAKQIEIDSVPPAKQTDTNTRKDKFAELYIRAEMLVPSIN